MKKTTLTDSEIEEKIEEIFEDNYASLKFAGNHSLTENTKKSALYQIIYYFKKLRHIVDNVKRTEVKLTLADRKTPKGRRYSIEGIVDLVEESKKLCMYDIKTHELEYVKHNLEKYKDQLNLYAHIYENLNQTELDLLGVISTHIPHNLLAHDMGTDDWKREFESWSPIVRIDTSKHEIEKIVNKFAVVVDKIENKEFKPVSVKTLNERPAENLPAFGVSVCRNCDGRFSCDSYREYIEKINRKSNLGDFFQIYLEDEEEERDLFLDNHSFETPEISDDFNKNE